MRRPRPARSVWWRGRRLRLASLVLLVAVVALVIPPFRPPPQVPAVEPTASRGASGQPLVPVEPVTPTPSSAGSTASTPSLDGLHVSGNQFVNSAGRTVRLVGFNFSGAEYSCIEGSGIFDAPDQTQVAPSVLAAMRSWQGANVVRLNLNEQCWLGLPAADPSSRGAVYQRAIRTLVQDLNREGFAVVLDLHRSAPGTATPASQEPMPDRDHSITFWRQVATTFRSNGSVLFDLFNEPFPYDGVDTTTAWKCWRDGGCTMTSANSGGSYVAAGMNELVAAVRGTGARNIILAGGQNYAEIMTRWLQYEPHDPTGNIAASVHVYSFNDCSTTACYDGAMARVAARVPMFVGEFGPDLTIRTGYDEHCPQTAVGQTGFTQALFKWMNTEQVSYAAWAFNPWGDCWSLVRNWSGAPTSVWGAQVKTQISRNATR